MTPKPRAELLLVLGMTIVYGANTKDGPWYEVWRGSEPVNVGTVKYRFLKYKSDSNHLPAINWKEAQPRRE